MKIAAILTSYNEDPQEVLATITSFQASVLPETDLHIILIDDGSPTPIDLDRGIELVRHDIPWGIGRSRNHGWKLASAWGADFVSMWDAHMRIPNGALEHMADRAMLTDCLVSLPSIDYRPDRGFFGCGTWMFWNRRDGLQIKWETKAPVSGEWERTPCFLGACYGMSSRTAQALEDATGNLWEDTAGRWGFSEQALCVKAYLMDVPVYVSGNKDFCAGHLYRSSNPVAEASKDTWRNVYRATRVLFSDEVWRERFLPHCARRVSEHERKNLDRVLEGEFPDGITRPWTVRRERLLFSELLGRDATSLSMHPDLEAGASLIKRAEQKLSRAGIDSVQNILVWRPTEHLVRLRETYPDANIKCIAMAGGRCDDWWDFTRMLNVEMHRVQPGIEYWERPLRVNWPTFDFILISGPWQDECQNVAKGFLIENGVMVVDADGGERILEHDDLRNERKAISSVKKTENDFLSSLPRALPSMKIPTVAVLLLNWRRPEQLKVTINSLEEQSVCPKLYLWDNADKPEYVYENDDRISVRINSSMNFGRFPRWFLASMVKEDYVCTLDDDVFLYDGHVLEDAIHAQATNCPDGIVGFFGWNEVEGRDYREGKHLSATGRNDTPVDVVKGCFLCTQSHLLTRVPMRTEQLPYIAADDVYVSAFIGQGRKTPHLLPSSLTGRWSGQGQDHAASGAVGHYDSRWTLWKSIQSRLLMEGNRDCANQSDPAAKSNECRGDSDTAELAQTTPGGEGDNLSEGADG